MRAQLFLTVLLKHLFFFLAQAVYSPLAYFVEDPVYFLLLVELLLVVFMIDGIVIGMRVVKKIIDQ